MTLVWIIFGIVFGVLIVAHLDMLYMAIKYKVKKPWAYENDDAKTTTRNRS